jgi:hypothetical protein
MLEASLGTPSQEMNNQEESLESQGQGERGVFSLATQGEVVVQRPIATVNVIHNHEKDNRVMPKEPLLNSYLPSYNGVILSLRFVRVFLMIGEEEY